MNEAIRQVAAQGPFQPAWQSLKAYEIPDWYKDAKFGIFIHWGVYSVPAYLYEWYPRHMYLEGSDTYKHHVATYGPPDKFGYKDFIPMMKYENYDPAEYAQLFVEAGAKFVVPVAEHHDGFAMYETALNRWNAKDMGPKRDVTGELADAVRGRGLVFGLSSHRAEHFWFFDGGRKLPSDVQDPEYADFYGPAEPGPEDWHNTGERPPSDDYMADWLARTCELVDKYQPQLIWFDWWIQNLAWKPYLQEFAAYYYNRGAEWGKGVAINYKYDAFEEGTAVFDVERGQLAGIRPQLWQNDTSVSKSSWGYTHNQDYKSVDSLVDDLVDIVSKNGALLLNIGPKPDGAIPDEEQAILRSIGQWLTVNGEAIYGTAPWHTFGEGPTEVTEGAFTDTNRPEFTGKDIRFTVKGDTLYAIALAWPGNALTIQSLASGAAEAGQVTAVQLLGHDAPLAFEQTAAGLHVSLPPAPAGNYAFTFKITRGA
jgi:alpha-L-fucosidase